MTVVLVCLFFQIQSWIFYESPDQRFRIAAPGPLTVQVDTITTEIGELYYHTLFYQADETAANQVYMLSYCDYPQGSLHSDSTELVIDFFKETIEEAYFSINGELRYLSEEPYFEYPARFWRIDYLQGQAVIKTKAIVAGNRYYAIQVAAPKVRHINPDSERFFDSFRLLE